MPRTVRGVCSEKREERKTTNKVTMVFRGGKGEAFASVILRGKKRGGTMNLNARTGSAIFVIDAVRIGLIALYLQLWAGIRQFVYTRNEEGRRRFRWPFSFSAEEPEKTRNVKGGGKRQYAIQTRWKDCRAQEGRERPGW